MLERLIRFIEIELKEKWDGKTDQIRRMSIVSDGSVRMAFLSVVGSHSVNGVAALHTKLLKEKLLSDFAELYLLVSTIKRMGLLQGDG